ncbi:hypothetical protein L1887_23270 [Cichorium endivia]|nr:hypothetical protein L1887_23270 [Cichorium endivia]
MNRIKKRDDCEDQETDDTKLNSNSLDQNLFLLTNSKSKEPLSINIAMFEQPLLKLTLVDILEATNNFCKSNIVGDGGFGTVYKAKLPDGKIVAVKKLNKSKTQGQREFLAEMETIGKVKHQNLVPLLGYCSFGEEKLACETHVSTDLAGTFGYIPPEYGQSWRSTTRGDVYSFGVILLELVTGKEPTGPEFKDIEGGNLVGWVFKKIKKGQVVDVLDPTVVNGGVKQAMMKTVQIAAICLSENPVSRPTMLHVLKFLKAIKNEYL